MENLNNLNSGLFGNYKSDIPAGFVVFLVALPLCLGVALASGAPLFAGIIAGVVGGLVVGYLSGSQLGVSGPAAGLVVIVLTAISDLGTFEAFLLAVVISGIIQIILGLLQAGIIGYFFPSSVIKGMLAAIGIMIMLGQLTHATGYDNTMDAEISFIRHGGEHDGESIIGEIFNMLNYVNYGVLIITLVSMAILLLWDTRFFKSKSIFRMFPGGLAAVITGSVLAYIFNGVPALQLEKSMFVNLPIPSEVGGYLNLFTMPDFSRIGDPKVYMVAVTIAVVGSIETLLSVEAADKLDPYKRITPANRELRAQGIGNIVSGLIGGIPVTQVIVRSSANVQSGGKSKLSTMVHGAILLIAALFLPHVLNLVPLSALSAILIMVGYKLAKFNLFRSMYKLGFKQFIPFIVTVVAIVFTDLLTGIVIGMMFGVFNILIANYRTPFLFERDAKSKKVLTLNLGQAVSFLNKGALIRAFNSVEEGCKVIIDGTRSETIDYDIYELIMDFKEHAKYKNIEVEIVNLSYRMSKDYFKEFVKAINDQDS